MADEIHLQVDKSAPPVLVCGAVWNKARVTGNADEATCTACNKGK